MYPISSGGAGFPQSHGAYYNPFTPSNDPLANLYPNASAGMEKNGSASDVFRQRGCNSESGIES